MKISKLTRSLATAALAGLAIGAVAPASAIVVGGVDFGIIGEAPIQQHLETTTIAETYINANGQILQGYGVVDRVNGDGSYATGTQKLFFSFTGYLSKDFTDLPLPGIDSVNFTGGVIDVYLGNDFNLLSQSSAANLVSIAAMTPWLTMTGHLDAFGHTLSAQGSLTGASVTFTGDGLLDVSAGLADVVAFLDANNVADGKGGFADIILSSSGNNRVLNPFDNTTGCRDGTAVEGQWCVAGSADLRGDTVVPEPGSIALVGLALAGMGLSARSRRRKSIN